MRNCDYGIPTPSEKRLKTSICLRPKSQPHRYATSEHRNVTNSISTPPQDQGRISFQLPLQPQQPLSEYYNHYPKSSHSFRSPQRSFLKGEVSGQRIQKWKRSMLSKMERGLSQLKQQITSQSSKITELQRQIKQQDRQLQSKNTIIQTLIAKLKNYMSSTPAAKIITPQNISQPFPIQKICDLQTKLRLLTIQIAQEHDHFNQKLQELTFKTIRFYGDRLQKHKKILYLFVTTKEKELILMEANIQKVENSQIQPFIRKSGNNLKSSTQGISSVRDTCSSVNSKQSLPIQRSNGRKRKDESLFSDYFFIPGPPSVTLTQPDSTTINAIQELIKDREQLPIRVFVDPDGRLKYWQSRTFVFDRKGNFSVPNESQIRHMQHKGWLKVMPQA